MDLHFVDEDISLPIQEAFLNSKRYAVFEVLSFLMDMRSSFTPSSGYTMTTALLSQVALLIPKHTLTFFTKPCFQSPSSNCLHTVHSMLTAD